MEPLSEVDSLIVEKEALKPLKKHEMKKLIEDAGKRGVKVEIIPSKLVFAKKPGKKDGKKKVRWCVCANFETKSPPMKCTSPMVLAQQHSESWCGLGGFKVSVGRNHPRCQTGLLKCGDGLQGWRAHFACHPPRRS